MDTAAGVVPCSGAEPGRARLHPMVGFYDRAVDKKVLVLYGVSWVVLGVCALYMYLNTC
jgi:hypothetical protein